MTSPTHLPFLAQYADGVAAAAAQAGPAAIARAKARGLDISYLDDAGCLVIEAPDGTIRSRMPVPADPSD